MIERYPDKFKFCFTIINNFEDRIVDFFLISFSDFNKHFIERTCFFADRSHLNDHGREKAYLLHCHLKLVTNGNIFSDLGSCLVINPVTSCT